MTHSCPVTPTTSVRLRPVFERYADRPFAFVIPGGNYGDHLIWLGGEKLARSCKLEYKTYSADEALHVTLDPKTVVYIHGSGGFVPWWSGTPAKVLHHMCRSHPGPIIHGPCTVEHEDPEYLKRTFDPTRNCEAEEFLVFARELPTLAALQKSLGHDCVGLDHDTALYLDAKDFPQITKLMPARGDYDFAAVRIDLESAGNNPGLSLDPAKIARSLDHWLALHACARSITTNRLHSSIAGSLFGVPTTLTPTSYHKARSVWEYSLQDRGVAWANEIQVPPGATSFMTEVLSRLAPRLNRSLIRRHIWRVQPKQLGLN